MINRNDSGRTIKVLVVHRQKMVVDQVKSVLQDSTAVVRFSDSGLDGLLTSRIESFDLIICGTDLPVITGFELVRSIRTNSRNKKCPVIFLSDHVDAKTEQLANALGVVAMLVTQEIENKLGDVVSERVKPEPDKVWEQFVSPTNPN
ncbi:MAG TPA: response regulator [Chryseosolibacter sp.]